MIRKTFLVILFLVFVAAVFILTLKYKELNSNYLSLKAQHKHIFLEKKKIEDDLEQISSLKDSLEQENLDLQNSLALVQGELGEALNKVRVFDKNLAALEVEKETIQDTLRREIILLRRRKNALSVRITSIGELKKALREAQRKQKLAQKAYKENLDKIKTMMGNKGFLIKDGEPTLKMSMRQEITIEILVPPGLE